MYVLFFSGNVFPFSKLCKCLISTKSQKSHFTLSCISHTVGLLKFETPITYKYLYL